MKTAKPRAFEELEVLWNKGMNILEALVYFASQKGEKRLPMIEDFVLSEVVAATCEYLSGKKDYSGYFRRLEDGKHCLENYQWQIKTVELTDELFAKYKEEFPTIFISALQKLVSLQHQTDHGEKWWDCWLYTFYKAFICRSPFVSTFSLSVEFVDHVENEVLPQFSREELSHIKEIAILMEKYVEEDIEFIKKQYCW